MRKVPRGHQHTDLSQMPGHWDRDQHSLASLRAPLTLQGPSEEGRSPGLRSEEPYPLKIHMLNLNSQGQGGGLIRLTGGGAFRRR